MDRLKEYEDKHQNERVVDLGFRLDNNKEGIGGFLIIIAGWNIATIINVLANLSTISQLKFALVNSRLQLPESYYDVANFGYKLLIPLAIVILYTFFKTKKIYRYLEVLNLVIRIAFVCTLWYILGDFSSTVTLANNLMLSIVVSAVSLIYLFFSKRVKSTFVN